MDNVRHDYMEMMLHHVLTIFLFGFAYLTNMTLCAAAIAYLHDIADIFTQYVRCFCETTFETVTILSAVGMTATWFYTRILVLPYMLYKGGFAIGDIYHGRNF
jgi:very-long-chain ceramide synthase